MIAETPLCKLAQKYGTDKSPWISDESWGHNYSPVYYERLKDKRKTFKKVLEMGVGMGKSMPQRVRRLPHYILGASLYMWRDFFPNAQIYGADILEECVFKKDRIETFLCDQGKKEDLENLIKKTGTDIDLFIDDGSHMPEHQIFTCLILKPLLKKDCIYVIEDVRHREIQIEIEKAGYKVEYQMFRQKHGFDDRLFFIT